MRPRSSLRRKTSTIWNEGALDVLDMDQAKLRQVLIGTPNGQIDFNLCSERYLFVQRAAGAQFARIAFLDE
jgi:hypothetical protein